MKRRLSPRAMYWGVKSAVYLAVYGTVDETVNQAVSSAMYWAVEGAGYGAVSRGVWGAMGRAGINQPPHPNFERFVGELPQLRGSAL